MKAVGKQLTKAFVILAWMGVSSGLILANNQCLSNGFPFPMTLTGFSMGFSGAASFAVCKVFQWARTPMTVRFYVVKILPVGLCMALTLYCGNTAYLYLTVAFIQMLKAINPVVTMLALFIVGLEMPSFRLVVSVLFIAIGTAIASLGQVNLSVTGLLLMAAAEVFEAIRLVLTQQLLKEKFHPLEALMYLAPACNFWLFLGSLFAELNRMVDAGALMLLAQQPLQFLLAASLGFWVNFLSYAVVEASSSLTLKVMGTIRNAFVALCGVFLLSEAVTLQQVIGYVISLTAFVMYQTKSKQD